MTYRDPSPLLLKRLWILEHLHDINSDLSVFHRMDDPESAPAARVVPLIERLVAYDGALKLTAMKQQEELHTSPTGRQRDVQKVYNRPEDNVEAGVLGLFERGAG